jgi:hypothetical protein
MLYKNRSNSFGTSITAVNPHITDVLRGPQPSSSSLLNVADAPPRLTLVPSGGGTAPSNPSPPLLDLLAISAHRCSAFFAEAAVLVLVLALLDRFMLKGRMELNWVVSAFSISLLLLAASIATEFSARRWLRAH